MSQKSITIKQILYLFLYFGDFFNNRVKRETEVNKELTLEAKKRFIKKNIKIIKPIKKTKYEKNSNERIKNEIKRSNSHPNLNSDEKGFEKNINLQNKKFDNLHLETINKVDNLIRVTENIQKKKEKNQGFIENLLNWGQSSRGGFQISEFLTTHSLSENKIGWEENEKNPNLTNNFNNGFFNKSINMKTKIMQSKNNVLVPTEEDFSKIKTNEYFDNLSLSEIKEKNKDIPPIKTKKKANTKWLFTSIPGFDNLLKKGIPAGSNIIIAGGPGSGKTIFCLQTIYNKALEGKDCVFLSMEERPGRLKEHMLKFGFKIKEIKREEDQIILRANGMGRISLKRLEPVKLARSIEALLEKASGTLPVDIDLVLDFVPEDFNTYLLALDSISAIETAFSGTNRQYRIYIEQLFRYFEHLNITTFLISETSDAPNRFSNTGVEEFLADGIFVFYIFHGLEERTRGAEIYKLRGAPHSQKIVQMKIDNEGLKITSKELII